MGMCCGLDPNRVIYGDSPSIAYNRIGAKCKKGRGCGPLHDEVVQLFHVNGLAVRVESAFDADLLAFVLLQPILPIDVIVLAAGILQNVLVARLHDRAAEGLAAV
jgi:hypothetical protein